MRRAAQRFINYIKSERGMSPATVHSYREDLRKFIEFLENHWGRCLLPGDVTPEMILAFLDFLANTGYQKKNGPASRASRLVAIATSPGSRPISSRQWMRWRLTLPVYLASLHRHPNQNRKPHQT